MLITITVSSPIENLLHRPRVFNSNRVTNLCHEGSWHYKLYITWDPESFDVSWTAFCESWLRCASESCNVKNLLLRSPKPTETIISLTLATSTIPRIRRHQQQLRIMPLQCLFIALRQATSTKKKRNEILEKYHWHSWRKKDECCRHLSRSHRK